MTAAPVAPATLSTDVHVHPSCVRAGVLPHLTANTIHRTVGEKNGWAVGLVHCSACGQTWATTVAVRPIEDVKPEGVALEVQRRNARELGEGDPAPRKARTLIAKAQALGLDVGALYGRDWVGVRLVRSGTASGWVVLWDLVATRDRIWARPPKPKGDPGLMVGPEGDLTDPYPDWTSAGAWRLDGVHRRAVASRDVDDDLKALGSAA